MKKIGKKVSFLTKILMAVSLLFSELMPLKYVFAYEKSEDLVIELTDDNHVSIKYAVESEYENLDVIVKESYKYLDDTYYLFGEDTTKTYNYDDVSISELSAGKKLDFTSIYSNSDILFDGTYKLEVMLVNEEEVVAANEFTKDRKFDSGISVRVFDSETEIISTDGKYNIPENALLKTNVLSGGLAPTWKYTMEDDETEYAGEELLNVDKETSVSLSGHLYGEHEFPESLTITRVSDGIKTEYSKKIILSMGELSDNTDNLNDIINSFGLDDTYHFDGTTNEGNLYVYPDLENGEARQVNDIISILDEEIKDSNITYEIKDGSTVIIDNTTPLKDGISVVLSCEDLTITYKTIVFADTNSDGIVDINDLEELIDKVLEIKDKNLKTDDIYNDQVLDFKDVISLFNLIKNGELGEDVGNDYGTLETSLVNSSDNIVSGDTFDVNYVVKLKETSINGILGEINYDKSLFELVEIVNKTDFEYGNDKDWKYFYLGETGLKLDRNEEGYVDIEYTLLTLKFRALKAGSGDIEVKNSKFINGNDTVLNSTSPEKITVDVNASSDNTLKSLKIGDNEIALKDGVFSYNLELEYSTQEVKAAASANHMNATVTLPEVNPQQLNVGNNEMTVTVTAENGDTKEYTVNVVRLEPSSDVSLKSLKIGDNEVSVKKDTFVYDVEVENTILEVKVAASASHKNATVTLPEVNPQQLNVGNNVITFTVTAENGDTKEYTVNVVRLEPSSDASLKTLMIAGSEITLKYDVYEYNIKVGSDVTDASVSAITNDDGATISSIISPTTLSDGDNTIKITVVAADGTEKTYTVIVNKEAKKEETKKNTGTYNNTTNNVVKPKSSSSSSSSSQQGEPLKEEDGSKLSRIIIIILILLVIAGLIYLIFKDDDGDDETKEADKQIDNIKRKDDAEVKKTNSSANKKSGSRPKSKTINKKESS